MGYRSNIRTNPLFQTRNSPAVLGLASLRSKWRELGSFNAEYGPLSWMLPQSIERDPALGYSATGHPRQLTAHGGKQTPGLVFGFSIGLKRASAGPCWIRPPIVVHPNQPPKIIYPDGRVEEIPLKTEA
jgi:hypothetical protein